MAKLRITYTKSAIGYGKDQKATIRALGLHKLNSIAIHDDTPSIRGMAFKVRHLVTVQELETAVATPADGDDLAVIEGIGPKIAGALQAAGITTFATLAATSVDQLNSILQAANLRLAHADTWPEQAALAAAGNWDALNTLTSELKGGRRV